MGDNNLGLLRRMMCAKKQCSIVIKLRVVRRMSIIYVKAVEFHRDCAYAQTTETRPFLLLYLFGPGNEANVKSNSIWHGCYFR